MANLESDTAPAATPQRRRINDARVDHQPGVVLHTTPWRETSLIVEAFTRDHGRIAMVARGAKRPTSQFRGLLAPFAPLAMSWSGRNEIKNLVRVEWIGGLTPLRGHALLAAFYANELLVRLLARADPHERLFDNYLQLLRGLAGARQDITLRAVRTGAAARGRLCGSARSVHERRADRRNGALSLPAGGRRASSCAGRARRGGHVGVGSDAARDGSRGVRGSHAWLPRRRRCCAS